MSRAERRRYAGANIVPEGNARHLELPSRVSSGLDLDYGFGTRLEKIGIYKVIAHSGDGEGWTSAAIRIDDADLIIVVLENTESYTRHAQMVASTIARRLLGIPDPLVTDVPLASGEQAPFTGKFQNGLDITVQHGTPFVRLWPGVERNRMLNQGESVFVSLPRSARMICKVISKVGSRVIASHGGIFVLAAERER